MGRTRPTTTATDGHFYVHSLGSHRCASDVPSDPTAAVIIPLKLANDADVSRFDFQALDGSTRIRIVNPLMSERKNNRHRRTGFVTNQKRPCFVSIQRWYGTRVGEIDAKYHRIETSDDQKPLRQPPCRARPRLPQAEGEEVVRVLLLQVISVTAYLIFRD